MSDFNIKEIEKLSYEEVFDLLQKENDMNKKLKNLEEIINRDGLVEKLLQFPNSQPMKEILLPVACKYNKIDLVKSFLDEGINPNGGDYTLWTPLFHACSMGYIDIIHLLLDKGADINRSSNIFLFTIFRLICPCSIVKQEVLELLIKRGTDVNLVEGGMTSMQNVLLNGNLNCVKLLLEKGATLTPLENGITSLHYAVPSGNIDLVKFLLERGENINAKSVDGCSVLRSSCGSKSIEMVRFLLENGAEINEGTTYELSPLKYAVEFKKQEIIDELLFYGSKDYFTSILPENEEEVNKLFEDFEKKMGNIKGGLRK